MDWGKTGLLKHRDKRFLYDHNIEVVKNAIPANGGIYHAKVSWLTDLRGRPPSRPVRIADNTSGSKDNSAGRKPLSGPPVHSYGLAGEFHPHSSKAYNNIILPKKIKSSQILMPATEFLSIKKVTDTIGLSL
jgi:hypothetical protein